MSDETKPVMCPRSNCQNAASDQHLCPYLADLGPDEDDDPCTCCDDCASECANDI